MATYRILTLDGGGIRGILTATILKRLEEEVPGWLDKVDLFAGTSTGGILALGLAKGLSPAELQMIYSKQCGKIFDDSWLDNIIDIGKVIDTQYSNRNLRKMILEILGSSRLGDLKKKVLVTSFDLDNEDPDPAKRRWKPKFFHNFPEKGGGGDANRLVVDVALYTSAAPSYFPARDGYIDGGVIANNPSMAALTQVFDDRAKIPNRPGLDEVRLLSVGTGTSLNRIQTRYKDLDWGYAQWAEPLLKILMDGSVGVADFQCKQLLGDDHYRRLNPTLEKPIDLADCDSIDLMVGIGEKFVTRSDVAWLKSAWEL